MTRWIPPLLAALLLTAAAADARAKAEADPRPTVAVLYFDYDGKDEQLGVLRKGLAQMLVSDLSAVEAVQVVERERLQEVLDEQKLQGTRRFDASTAVRVGKLLGARFLVLGRYFDLLGTLRVDARLVDVETGTVVRGVGHSGKLDEFLDVQGRVAEGLREVLTSALPKGASAPRRPAARKRRAKRPKKLDAATAARYGAALEAADKGDAAGAKKALEGVLKEQPDFELAALDLARLVR